MSKLLEITKNPQDDAITKSFQWENNPKLGVLPTFTTLDLHNDHSVLIGQKEEGENTTNFVILTKEMIHDLYQLVN
jgi:hypothetical protein